MQNRNGYPLSSSCVVQITQKTGRIRKAIRVGPIKTRTMNILNALLTGGVLVGKVCQALSPSTARKFHHAKSGISIYGDVQSGGVKFFRKEFGGQSIVYAANTSSKEVASIVVPNDPNGSGDGITYFIQPMDKLPIAEVEHPLVSPLTQITTGLVGSDPVSARQPSRPLVKLAVSALKLGKAVNVGSFRLEISNAAALTVTTSSLTISAITFFNISTNNGISASSQSVIKVTNTSTKKVGSEVEKSFEFPIPFVELGIDPSSDTIDGQITFEVEDTVKDVVRLSHVKSEPLDEAEIAYLQSKGLNV